MIDPKDAAMRITRAAIDCKDFDIIEPARIGEGEWKNELLFFIKPEVFMLGEENAAKTVQMVLDTLSKFGAVVDGISAVGGKALDRHRIMSSHYGFINVLSTSASRTVDTEGKKKIEEAFSLSPGGYEILGGHEYLDHYPKEDSDMLDTAWFAEKSTKIRSGFYVRLLDKDGKKVVLVNGFHPKQLAYFTDPSHKIVLMLIHSNTDWKTLKNTMVGATFPEKADQQSIRGILYKDAKEYGFEEVTIANNCVHLSAGPFEAVAEISNFFGKLAGARLEDQKPLLIRKMISGGMTYAEAAECLGNPQVMRDGKQMDLFSATEDMDSEPAIGIYKSSLRK